MRGTLLGAALCFLSSCSSCYSSGDEPPPPVDCVDVDEDDYGVGADCRGGDCDDADPSRHADCSPPCPDDPVAPGCPCAADAEPQSCYFGPEGTLGVGACQSGLRVCEEGAWSACNNQVHPLAEWCNEEDDDCDGTTDEEVIEACGDCDRFCHVLCAGVGCDDPLIPDRGAALDEEGALVVEGEDVLPNVVWLTHPLYKLDATTMDVLAVYIGGIGSPRVRGALVNERGDVFSLVGDHSVMRVAGSNCPDANGDGVVRTSDGYNALPYGEDECLLWNTRVRDCDDCNPGVTGLTLADLGDVLWIGINEEGRTHAEMDAETGELTGRGFDLETSNARGLIADGAHNLWVMEERRGDPEPAVLFRVPLDSLNDIQSWIVPSDLPLSNVELGPDGSILTGARQLFSFDPVGEAFEVRDNRVSDIAVDLDEHIWLHDGDGHLLRFDSGLDDPVPFVTDEQNVSIAAGLDGSIWTADSDSGVVRAFDQEDGTLRGTAPDWLPAGLGGDPTGIRFRRTFGAAPRGRGGAVFDGSCEGLGGYWDRLSWQTAGIDPVLLQVRSAEALRDLDAAPWIEVGQTPPAEASVPLDPFLGRYLEVRARLRGASAELRRLEVMVRCNPPD